MRSIAISFLLLTGAVFADKPPTAQQKAEAKSHFSEGEKAFRLGDFARAIEEYRKSYELFPAPLLLFDLGQAYRKAGEYEKALHAYQQYLDTAPSAERRATVEGLVSELNGLIEQQRKAQSAPPAGTSSSDANQQPVVETRPQAPSTPPAEAPASAEAPRHSRFLLIGAIAAAVVIVAVAIVVGVVVAAPKDAPIPMTSVGNAVITF